MIVIYRGHGSDGLRSSSTLSLILALEMFSGRVASLGLVLKWLVFTTSLVRFARAARLVDFQVAQPPPVPEDAKTCTVEILE